MRTTMDDEHKSDWRSRFDADLKPADDSKPPTWRTKEMALAAYLGCLGRKTIGMELEGGSRTSCYWLFEDTEGLVDEVFEFLEGKAQVEPNEFNNQVAALKNAMFDEFRRLGISTGRR